MHAELRLRERQRFSIRSSVDMKATFATVALLVLALSWAGSGAVEVQVSKQVHADGCLGQHDSMKKGPGPRQQILTLQRCQALFTFIFSSLQENGLTFSLEAVQRLQELAESSAAVGLASPRLRAGSASLCGDPLLPQEFLPLCRQRGASASIGRLGELFLCPRADRGCVCGSDGAFVLFCSHGSHGSL